MTKPKAKASWYPTKKRSAPKPKYRKPTEADREKRQRQRDVGTQIQLLELQLSVLRQQQKAIFYSLDKRQQQLVVAYEEE